MKKWVLLVSTGMLSIVGLTPQASAADAQVYWQCKATNPVGWCPASAANPLPTTGGGGGGGAVTIANGADVALGNTADSACATDTGTCTLAALLKRLNMLITTLNTNVTSAIPPGTALIGKVGIDQTTPGTTNGVVTAASTAGGATPYHYISTASTNSTSIKGSAGTLYVLTLHGLNTTVGYVRVYDTASAPTCSSATGEVFTFAVIGSATQAGGIVVPIPSQGIKFTNGIGFCVTGGSTDTDNTSGPAGILINGAYN